MTKSVGPILFHISPDTAVPSQKTFSPATTKDSSVHSSSAFPSLPLSPYPLHGKHA